MQHSFRTEREFHDYVDRTWPGHYARPAKGLAGAGEVRRDGSPRQRTATHEAGHAVVGALMGIDLAAAVLMADGGGAAQFYTYDRPPAVLAMAMAGSLAAAGDLSEMSDTDREIAHEQARAIVARHGGSTAAVLRNAEAQARFYIREHIGAVDEVAAELARRGKLFGAEIVAVIERHRGRPLRPGKADVQRERSAAAARAEAERLETWWREWQAGGRARLDAECRRYGIT